MKSSHQPHVEDKIVQLEETISQKNHIIEILTETLHHYRLIADMSPHAIFVVDRDGFFQYVNCHLANLMKNSACNIIGKHLRALFPPETYELQRNSLLKVVEEKKPYRAEEKIVFPGSVLWMDTNLFPIKDNYGHVSAVLGIASNMRGPSSKKDQGKSGFDGRPIGSIYSEKRISTLTIRETEILKLISSGFTNRKIAEELFISVKTVDTHRSRIMRKLNAKNTADLVRFAINSGIV